MKKFEIDPLSTMIAQIPMGQKTTVVLDDEGILYIPMANMKAILGGGGSVAASAGGEAAPVADIAKPGRRGAAAKTAPPAAAEAGGGIDEVAVGKIIVDLDATTIAPDDALVALKGLCDAGNHAAMEKAIAEFMADSTMTVDAAKAAVISAMSGKAAATAGRKGRGAAPAAGPVEITDLSTLTVGQKVKVYLDSTIVDAPDWYDATVETAGRKKSFKFDDDNEVMDYVKTMKVSTR